MLACKKLRAFLKLSNVCFSDAITNLLMVESVLRDKDVSAKNFAVLYRENPSRSFRIRVPDRSIFKTIWDESRLEEPKEL